MLNQGYQVGVRCVSKLSNRASYMGGEADMLRRAFCSR